ncbi:uncharacterized protein LOC135464792 [Liolophura sinensis]|uniref:uncharacterized protein LOC135464792 n=1 Tax=Liolophura sinensis TaxID=3198878 RepID=UPI003158E0CB
MAWITGLLALVLFASVVSTQDLRYAQLANLFEANLKGIDEIGDGSCMVPALTSASCCVTMYGHSGCIVVKYLMAPSNTLSISFTLDSITLKTIDVPIKNPDPPCFTFKGKRVCLEMYDVQITTTSFSACLKITVHAGFMTKSVKMGCFSLTLNRWESVLPLLFKSLDENRDFQLF